MEKQIEQNPTIINITAYKRQPNLYVSLRRKKQNLSSTTLQKGALLQIKTFGLPSSRS